MKVLQYQNQKNSQTKQDLKLFEGTRAEGYIFYALDTVIWIVPYFVYITIISERMEGLLDGENAWSQVSSLFGFDSCFCSMETHWNFFFLNERARIVLISLI